MRDLLEHVEKNIGRRHLFSDGQTIVVAVSGGLDSMVLLRLLHELSPKYRWTLIVAHVNHQLRGRSSDADERLVRRIAKKLKLRVVVEGADVRRFARAHRLSIEMAARKVRHDFLARVAVQREPSTVALAHHADDQLELFFLRLLRGSGAEGLAGMKWRNRSPSNHHVELVRPLLALPKSSLLDYAAKKKIPFREDASNECLDFQRNRIRHELLPLLRKKYQPALHKTVLRTLDIIEAEAGFVVQSAREWLDQTAKAKGGVSRKGHRSSLARRPSADGRLPTPFDDLPVAVQRRCVQLQLLKLGLEADYDLVERLRTSPERMVSTSVPTSRVGPAPDAIHVSRDKGGLIQRVKPPPGTAFSGRSFELNLTSKPGEVVFDGVRISWRLSAKGGTQRPKPQTGCEYFDPGKVGSRLILRHWQAGDRFQPIGLPNSVKLQDFFTNEKISRSRRHELIVASTANDEIFWVEGFRISEQFKLTKATRHRLQWRWKRV